MFPILFSIGSFPVHSYGLLIAIGFLLAVFVIRSEAKRIGWNTELLVDWCFMVLLVGFIGARVVFILTRWSYFAENPIEALYVWEGGLVFYGGPLFVVPWAVFFAKRHRLSLAKLSDISVPGVVIAHAFGRLGCLASGCCYGHPTGRNWGVKLFSELVDPNLRGVFLHPTQLYESGALFILFFLLWFLRTRTRFNGQLGLTYFLFYPVIRSIIEVFRGDTIRGFVIDGVLSTSQFISILVFTVALFFYLRETRRK